jgi:spermidine dehydrogenase
LANSHKNKSRDRELGMHREITRRDFLQGAALGLTAPLLPLLGAPTSWAGDVDTGAQAAAGYYPPALTGLRGSHAGAFETAHALRDGRRWDRPRETHEHYDLVVVGAGISGLSAAHFYLAHSPAARILILDNHDDFGGHARRNEFHIDGRLQLMNGGTLSIESPKPYSSVADGLLKSVGIDRDLWASKLEDKKFFSARGMSGGIFFDRETFGADKLVLQHEGVSPTEYLADAPLSAQVKKDIARIEESQVDYLPGLSSPQKKERLAAISYQQFLLTLVHADSGVCDYYRKLTHGLWGVGIDAVSALDCWGVGMPGFQGMAIQPGSIPRMGYTPAGSTNFGWTPVIHFPDGNATVARSLVRRLIPAAIPGAGVEDLITAKANYAELDRAKAQVRLRLNSTVVAVKNLQTRARAANVSISYVRGESAYRVQARHCVLACWNRVIPYLCPELPPAQAAALREPSKVPLLYISVALRNWSAFDKLKVNRIYAPGSYYSDMRLNEMMKIGGYATPREPDEPTVLHATRTPCSPGLAEHDQNKLGRADILATTFETYERNMREQLGRTLGAGGFDPAKDILAITVNRWPHGYAHEFNALFDELKPEGQSVNVVGRARVGNIAIANADAAAAAYTDKAIDEAYRAVQELNPA